ncbi:MAG: hypothetical protein ACE5F6_05530 [Anaerolineae bacterium]
MASNQFLRMTRVGGSLLLIAAVIALVLVVAPLDRVLGDVSRLVYLHGAMVWVALAGFTVAGILGVTHLLTDKPAWHRWSQGVERSAILFWGGYLPLSVVAADLAWNGVFWAEPRWAMAAQIFIVAVAFQVGGALLDNPQVKSTLNALMAGAVWWLLLRTPLIIHPDNPIGTSDSVGIKLAFASLVILCGLAALQIARWLRPRTS